MELRGDGENRGSSGGRQTKETERVEHGVNGRPHPTAESLRKSPRPLRRPPVFPLKRGAADNRTLATEVPKARCN